MNRFDEHGLRRFTARQAVAAVGLAALLLVLFDGGSIRTAGERMGPGIGRDLVLLVGRPAGWIADRLPLEDAARHATAWLSPDEPLDSAARFGAAPAAASRGTPPVTAAAFDPAAIGAPAPPRRPLHRLLVTGDSLSTPLDTELARALAGRHVEVIRDPHLGTGISKSFLVDWGQLSAAQVRRHHPDAVVVFVGANEGFPMTPPGGHAVSCCGADWAAVYANRLRRMTETYRRRGAARVYWITLPLPRDPARQRISRVVNAAIEVAAEPWRADVRVLDTVPTFTPHGYRDAMPVGGRAEIVRRADGIHLNEVGARVLAGMVLSQLGQDFAY